MRQPGDRQSPPGVVDAVSVIVAIACVTQAEALQAAKRWLREYRVASGAKPDEHPSYGAAFVLTGT